MNKADLINKIIYLPKQFHSLGNVSMYSLLEESGYFEMYDQVNEVDIMKGITENSECINDWIILSEDKRCSGWYITQNSIGGYVVGYFPETENFKLTTYIDVKEACAAFIKREIESIRI